VSRRLRALAAVLFALAGPAFVLAHCDDVSPLVFVPPVRDAEAPDRVDEARIEACRECLAGDGGRCHAQYESCIAMDPRCAKYTECLTATFCWEQFDPTNFGALPPCAIGCFQDAGISGLNEILGAAAPGYFCIVDPNGCGSVCIDRADAGGANARGASAPSQPDSGDAGDRREQ
jgi:hypothetical protein